MLLPRTALSKSGLSLAQVRRQRQQELRVVDQERAEGLGGPVWVTCRHPRRSDGRDEPPAGCCCNWMASPTSSSVKPASRRDAMSAG